MAGMNKVNLIAYIEAYSRKIRNEIDNENTNQIRLAMNASPECEAFKQAALTLNSLAKSAMDAISPLWTMGGGKMASYDLNRIVSCGSEAFEECFRRVERIMEGVNDVNTKKAECRAKFEALVTAIKRTQNINKIKEMLRLAGLGDVELDTTAFLSLSNGVDYAYINEKISALKALPSPTQKAEESEDEDDGEEN